MVVSVENSDYELTFAHISHTHIFSNQLYTFLEIDNITLKNDN